MNKILLLYRYLFGVQIHDGAARPEPAAGQARLRPTAMCILDSGNFVALNAMCIFVLIQRFIATVDR